MKKIVLIAFVVVLVLATAIPVFADPGNPNGPPECRGKGMAPGRGVSANVENMRGPDGENNGRGHFQWLVDGVDIYDGDPGAANITCWFFGLPTD